MLGLRSVSHVGQETMLDPQQEPTAQTLFQNNTLVVANLLSKGEDLSLVQSSKLRVHLQILLIQSLVLQKQLLTTYYE